MGAHRRDRELNRWQIAAVMFLLTLGLIAFLLLIGALAAVAIVYHFYWGLACIPAGIVIGCAVTWAVGKYGR